MKSPRFTPLALAAFFAAGAALFALPDKRPPPPKEKWDAPARAAARKNPLTAEAALLAKGKATYEKMCASCHGKTGHGEGPAVKDLDVDPGTLVDAQIAGQSDGALFWKLTEGKKPMPSYAAKLSEEERWQVILYVRSLAGPGK